MGYITPGHLTISFWPSSPCYTCIWFCVGMLLWSLISCWAWWICRLGLSQAFRLDTGRISLCHTCIYGLVARYANQLWCPSYQHLYHAAPSSIWRARLCLSNTPARETQPSSPNTTGSCVMKVLIRRTSKLIGVSSDKPINTSVAQGDATCV